MLERLKKDFKTRFVKKQNEIQITKAEGFPPAFSFLQTILLKFTFQLGVNSNNII